MPKPLSLLLIFVLAGTLSPLHAQESSGHILYSACSKPVGQGCTPSLWTMNGNGTSPRLLVQATVRNRGEYNVSASPDGKWISFNTYRYSGWKLAMAKATNGTVQDVEKFTTSRDYEYNLKWSPDGAKVVFQVYNWGKSDTDVFIANADRSQMVNLTNAPGDDRTPTFSADGRQIVFASTRTGNNDIFTMDLDGTNVRNLTNHAAHDMAPSVSPQGRIAFLSNREGPLDVFVLERAGAEPINLTKGRYGSSFTFDNWQNSLSWAYKTSWSPDGNEVVFNLKVDGNFELFKAHIETGVITQLTDNDSEDFGAFWAK